MQGLYILEHLPPQYRLPKLAPNPFPTKYELGIDISPELDPDLASYFQSLIGIMCWMVKLGCIDIATKVSLLTLHLALSHEGHMDTFTDHGLPWFTPQFLFLYGSNLSQH